MKKLKAVLEHICNLEGETVSLQKRCRLVILSFMDHPDKINML